MIYLAYGSNLHLPQMERRCPTAKVIGAATLTGYRLLFRGNGWGGVATVEPDAESSVPVLLWEIQPADEPTRKRRNDPDCDLHFNLHSAAMRQHK